MSGICHNDHDDELAVTHFLKPTREKQDTRISRASSNLVGVEKCRRDCVPILGKQIRMACSDMLLALVRLLNIALKLGTSQAAPFAFPYCKISIFPVKRWPLPSFDKTVGV